MDHFTFYLNALNVPYTNPSLVLTLHKGNRKGRQNYWDLVLQTVLLQYWMVKWINPQPLDSNTVAPSNKCCYLLQQLLTYNNFSLTLWNKSFQNEQQFISVYQGWCCFQMSNIYLDLGLQCGRLYSLWLFYYRWVWFVVAVLPMVLIWDGSVFNGCGLCIMVGVWEGTITNGCIL